MKPRVLLSLLFSTLLFALLGCETTQSGAARAPRSDPAIYDSEVAKAEALGRLIYFHDQLAWVATDMLMTYYIGLEEHQLAGWIDVETDEGWVVKYLEQADGKPRILTEILFPGPVNTDLSASPLPDPVLRDPEVTELTEAEDIMLRAHYGVVAVAEEEGVCDENTNHTVFANPYGEGYLAYALTPFRGEATVRLGGYFRINVAQDGSYLAGRRFANSCLEMTPEDLPKDTELSHYMITHFLDPHPTEIHVFLSLQHPMPLLVLTPQGQLWEVNAGKITPVNLKK